MVPCDTDIAFFPSENSINLDIQEAENIMLKDIIFNNKSHIEDFVSFSNTDLGLTMFKNSRDTMLRRRNARCRAEDYAECSCHHYVKQYNVFDLLCENEKPFCKPPPCINPIKPEGHCCLLCGASIILYGESVKAVRESVEKLKQSDSSYDSDLYTHISSKYDYNTTSHRIQIVAVDKGEYNELSSSFVKELNITLHSQYSSIIYNIIK